MTRLLGAVLAGGASRRFGSDKADALLDGVRLIDRAIAGLAGQVADVVVCGRDNVAPPGLPDRPPGRLGPLAGLNAALHHARTHGFDAVVSLPCDVAACPADLVALLEAHGPIAFAPVSPVIGLWPAGLAAVLDRHLSHASDRSMRHWAATCGATPCDVGPIRNINARADLDTPET